MQQSKPKLKISNTFMRELGEPKAMQECRGESTDDPYIRVLPMEILRAPSKWSEPMIFYTHIGCYQIYATASKTVTRKLGSHRCLQPGYMLPSDESQIYALAVAYTVFAASKDHSCWWLFKRRRFTNQLHLDVTLGNGTTWYKGLLLEFCYFLETTWVSTRSFQ